ncbi:serine hydrolase domain-containing protein [Pseudohongiella sp.]|uniref:Beta-lactamase-related domain-containing protein n=1 Tax=marine sediment metagenome TaxID=412755 RepID=A0A0F9YKR2_9ZZZZ|nr:serine hydrolase domain-containing protein [Pseudohongiella sp.]
MKTFSIIANRRQRLRQVDGKPFMLSLVLLWAALAGSGAHADSVDGREIPEFANGSIVLPELAFGGDLYSVELTLVSASGPEVMQVSDSNLIGPAGTPDSYHDHAARLAGNTLSIPVFAMNGRYYAAEMDASFSITGSAPQFQLKNLWPVTPGKLSVPVAGLDYVSGTRAGVTDSQGRFYGVEGSPVAFSIGALGLGNQVSVTASTTSTYASLFAQGENDPAYSRSLQVLGLLDADHNSVNGIQLTASMKQVLADPLAATNLASGSFSSQYSALATAAKGANADAVSYTADAAEINFQKLEIQSYMLSRLQQKSIPGVALSIELPNGEIWHTAAGVADTQTGEALTPKHKFRIGSATKSFTGMLIMQLVDEGKLSLDQKLSEFFPGKFPSGDVTTIKMLLNHTAGIFSFTNEFPDFERAFGVTMDVEPSMTDLWFVRYIGMPGFVYAPGELVDIGASINSAFARNNATADRPYLVNEPGQKWNYSNTHYVLLQEIAEMVTQNSWQHEIRTRFVEPLGLTDTVVPSPGELKLEGTYARGYVNWADNQGPFVADLFGFPHTDVERTNTDPAYTMGSGAMISTAADLVKWANAVMEGQLMSPATQALMREPFEVQGAFGESINMLQGVVQDLGLQVFGHRGQIVGYDASWQYHYRNPNDVIGTGRAMAVLLNRTLLTESNPDGSIHISDVNQVMLEGILDILYGTE